MPAPRPGRHRRQHRDASIATPAKFTEALTHWPGPCCGVHNTAHSRRGKNSRLVVLPCRKSCCCKNFCLFAMPLGRVVIVAHEHALPVTPWIHTRTQLTWLTADNARSLAHRFWRRFLGRSAQRIEQPQAFQRSSVKSGNARLSPPPYTHGRALCLPRS